jgi:hypothetical protein
MTELELLKLAVVLELVALGLLAAAVILLLLIVSGRRK